MRLFIEPNEPLMFRTGRPFDAGQDNFAESLFPPTPETLQGAVRAAIASNWDSTKNITAAFDDPQLTARIGDYNGYGRFRITGISLGQYKKDQPHTVERLFIPPAHIRRIGTDHDHLLRLSPKSLDAGVWSNMPEGIHHYLVSDQKNEDDLKPLENCWLTETDLQTALGTDDLTGIKVVKRSDIYQEEPRLGIGIQPGTKASQEGFLYQIVMLRMNHHMEHSHIYGFVVDVRLTSTSAENTYLDDQQTQKELNLPSKGWMTMGGEQRTAHFRVIPTVSEHKTRPAQARSLLYLATPAVFTTGWRPSPKFAPLDAPLTAAINRYESIGGWKLQAGKNPGKNKAMYRCVPAGSIYFFDKHVTAQRPLTDSGIEIGYGITFEGEW